MHGRRSGCALAAPGAGFASVADALRVSRAAAYLNSPAAAGLEGAARGEALEAARGDHLPARRGRQRAAAPVRRRRRPRRRRLRQRRHLAGREDPPRPQDAGRRPPDAAPARHPLLDAAAAAGAITISWAREIAGWTGRIDHEELQSAADQILVEAAAAGRGPRRPEAHGPGHLRGVAGPGPNPEEDPGGRGFGDRYLLLDTTMDGAGPDQRRPDPRVRRRGHRGPGGAGQAPRPGGLPHRRAALHDALQEGCELLIRAKMVPDRAGADTRVDVAIPLSDLLGMDGASVIEDTWLRARAGQHGYLSGKDAEAIACDALIVPVVTGSPDWALIGQMITLVADAYAHAADAQHGLPAQPGQPARPRQPAAAAAAAAARAVAGPAVRPRPPGHPVRLRPRRPRLRAAPRPPRRPPEQEKRHPRRRLLRHHPRIDPPGRHARDQGCAWPGGCDSRPAACDVHHIRHKKHGGKTSVKDCVLLCQFHHDICIHRMGWEIGLLPDGSTRATSPDRQGRPPQPRATTDNPTQRLTPDRLTPNRLAPNLAKRPTRQTPKLLIGTDDAADSRTGLAGGPGGLHTEPVSEDLGFPGEIPGFYHRYRRGYPPPVIDRLVGAFGLTGDDFAIDLGCGTGS